MNESLENALEASKKDLNKTVQRQQDLLRDLENVETRAQKAIKDMRHQLNEVTANLASMVSNQVGRVKKAKAKQILQFNAETVDIQKKIKRREKIEADIRVLLESPMTAGMVQQAEGLLRDPSMQLYVEGTTSDR